MTGQPEEIEKYTKVPNDILDALAQAKLNGTQHAICLVIFRNTFGFHRCKHEMSATYIGKATNISARQIKRELQSLTDRNIIFKTNLKKGVTSNVGFNKDITTWKPVTKKTPVSNPSPVVVSNKTPVPVSNPSPKKESIKKKKEIIYSQDSQEFILSQYLLDKILGNNPGNKIPDLNSWSKQMDLILRVDERQPDEVKMVIDFCQTDSFWKSNILSVGKLREKYDQLNIKRKGSKQSNKYNHSEMEGYKDAGEW